METVSGAWAAEMDSDELPTHACDPCGSRGTKRDATDYCKICDKYFCSACKTDSHKTFKTAINHKIFSMKALAKRRVPIRKKSGPVVTCSCYQDLEAIFYCTYHDDVICQPCKSLKHEYCNVDTISEKSAYDATRIDSEALVQRTNELQKQIDNSVTKDKNDLVKLGSSKKSCKKEIKRYRSEINLMLDNLEESSYKELEKFEMQKRGDIENHLSVSSKKTKMLEADIKFIDDIIKTGEAAKIFAANVKISNRLKQYAVEDFSKEPLQPLLTFKGLENLIKMLENLSGLGSVKVDQSSHSSSEKSTLKQMSRSFHNIKVKKSNYIDIKFAEQRAPYVSGCVFMPKGELLFCDYFNKKVKLLSASFTLQSSLDMKTRPWDVSAVDDNSAIVSLPDSGQLRFIVVEPSLNFEHVIQLDKPCWGVDIAGDQIYVTCHNSGFFTRDGELRVLDMNGNILRRFGTDINGSHALKRPYYVSVCASSGKIFVSDSIRNTFTFFESNGAPGCQFIDPDLRWPRGIIVDDEDNVVICDSRSHSVHIVSADGMHKIFLTEFDNLKSPYSVAYRHTDGTMVVGCEDQNNLFVFEMMS